MTKNDSDATLVSDKPDIYFILSEIWMFVCPAVNLILLYTGGYKNMPVWASILCAAITAGIPSAVTLFLSRKSKLTKNTESLENLEKTLISYKEQQEKNYQNIDKEISDKIGKGIDDPTLTGQHKKITELIEREIALFEKRYVDEEKRINKFTKKQKDMAKTLEEFRLFLESWQILAENEEILSKRISELESENQKLEARNNELEMSARPPRSRDERER